MTLIFFGRYPGASTSTSHGPPPRPKIAKWPLASVVRSGPPWLLRPHRIATLEPSIGSPLSFLIVPSTRARPPRQSCAASEDAHAATAAASIQAFHRMDTSSAIETAEYTCAGSAADAAPLVRRN